MKNRTNLIFLHKLIKAFADSLIKAFIPLIILKASNNMVLVMLYLNVYYIMCGVLNIVLKRFLQKYGVIAIILHIIPLVALQFVLALEMTIGICIVLAVLASFAQVLYSVPLNLLFAFTDKEFNVAKFQIATNIGKFIFVILSGYVLGSSYKNSILLLSIIGTVLYVLSVVPIMYGYKLIKDAYITAVKSPTTKPNKTGYLWFNIFHMAFSLFQSVLDVLVPIYLYVNNLTFETVALVVALIEVLKIFANMFAKYLVKHNKALLSTLLSVSAFMIGSVLILIIKVPVVLYICTSLIAISFPLIFVPMFGTYCKKLKADGNQFDGMSLRDIYILNSKSIMYLPYFAFPNLLGQFIIGMVSGVTVGVSSFMILKKPKAQATAPTSQEQTTQGAAATASAEQDEVPSSPDVNAKEIQSSKTNKAK